MIRAWSAPVHPKGLAKLFELEFHGEAGLALRKPRFYTCVEGYAINTWVADYPVAHAWCVDPEHFVVDTTWDEGADYFGVPFRAEYVRRMAGARRRD